jgi:hypothetical protein
MNPTLPYTNWTTAATNILRQAGMTTCADTNRIGAGPLF